jgi:hypothetical protein
MTDPTLAQLSFARRRAAAELEAAEAAEAALQAQLAAATALTAAKRDNLAAAERALRAGEDEALKQLDPVAVLPIDVASLVFAALRSALQFGSNPRQRQSQGQHAVEPQPALALVPGRSRQLSAASLP